MAELQKTVLMVHLDEEQGKIWQLAIASQQIEVVWEPIDIDFVELLKSTKQNNLPLPDLLLMDIGIKAPNSQTLQSSSVCQWCSKNHPALKVVLFNPRLDRIKEMEHNWAVRRGAVDVLPRLTSENLTVAVARLTSALGVILVEAPLHEIAQTIPAWEGTVPGKEIDINRNIATSQENLVAKTNRLSEKPKESVIKEDDGLIYRGVRVKKK